MYKIKHQARNTSMSPLPTKQKLERRKQAPVDPFVCDPPKLAPVGFRIKLAHRMYSRIPSCVLLSIRGVVLFTMSFSVQGQGQLDFFDIIIICTAN
jgi:hypothetical protein